jgi:hypothetical protein
MVISCAVFGLALGGLPDVVAPPTASALDSGGLHRLALAFAASVWAIPLLLNAILFPSTRRATARWRSSAGFCSCTWCLLMTAPLPLRIAATAALIGPVAFFMGMPFPLGLLELAGRPRGAVAWAWSMNGLFTTIGGVASALLSLAFGFRFTILAALGMYALAAVAFAWVRQTQVAPLALPRSAPIAEGGSALPTATPFPG